MMTTNLRIWAQRLGAAWLVCALYAGLGCGEVRTSQGMPDAGVPGGGCARETDPMFCERLGASCGMVTDYDACGLVRTAACGVCSMPERCGGGGTPNMCAVHPPLLGMDGYIVGTTRFQIVFATDGVTSSSGYCCSNTLAEARQAYPDYNLIYLPASSPMLGEGVIPPLRAVDGYIRLGSAGQYEVAPAVDGALTEGEPLCCYASVEEARIANPERNLAWLRP